MRRSKVKTSHFLADTTIKMRQTPMRILLDASAHLTYAISLDAGGGGRSKSEFDAHLAAERIG